MQICSSSYMFPSLLTSQQEEEEDRQQQQLLDLIRSQPPSDEHGVCLCINDASGAAKTICMGAAPSCLTKAEYFKGLLSFADQQQEEFEVSAPPSAAHRDHVVV